MSFSLDDDRIDFLTKQREGEWSQMQAYLTHQDCLMRFLQDALDDPSGRDCERCVNCAPVLALPRDVDAELAKAAAEFLRHFDMPLRPKAQVARDGFEIYPFRGNLPQALRAAEGRVMSRWADAGWGHLVAAGKHAGRFDDGLVLAMARMIDTRWRPAPSPKWVTCVPSLRHPTLVPDFSLRLSKELDLPYIALIEKIRDHEPQKEMNNRYHQCRNLDGVFRVSASPPPGPGLLVDDVHDSGWTLTVVAALLRQEGAEMVYPVTLATASN